MSVPKSIIDARPSADLWENQEDEIELGFPYDFIELFTEYLKFNDQDKSKFISSLDEKASSYFKENSLKAQAIHNKNKHKVGFPHIL